MNREYIIIIICIFIVGLFYMQSREISIPQPVEQVQPPDFIQSDVTDKTKTAVPDSLRK